VTNEEKREFLYSYAYSLGEVHYLEMKLEHWKDVSIHITSNITGLSSNTSPTDKIAEATSEIVDLKRQISTQIINAKKQMEKVESAIKTLKNNRYQIILSMRFILGMTVDEVAFKLHKSTRNIQMLQKKAIEALEI